MISFVKLATLMGTNISCHKSFAKCSYLQLAMEDVEMVIVWQYIRTCEPAVIKIHFNQSINAHEGFISHVGGHPNTINRSF